MLDYDDLLLYFAQMLAEPTLAAELAARFDHLLVDEYQDTNSLQAEIVLALRPRGRGLTVVGDDAQSIYSFRAATVRNILDFPQRVRSAGPRRRAGAQLPLDRADPRRLQRRHRAAPRALAEDALDRQTRAAARRCSSPSARRPTRRAMSPRACSPTARRARASNRRRCCFAPPATRRARTGADPPQHPVRQIRRPQIPRRGACEGRARAAALRREPARPGRRLPRHAASAGDRAGHRGEDGRRRRRPTDAFATLAALSRAGEGAREPSPSSPTSCAARSRRGALARRSRRDRRLAARRTSRRSTTTRASRRPISTRWSASPRPIPRASVS